MSCNVQCMVVFFFKEKVHFVAAISPDSKRIGPLNQVYCYSLHAHLFFAKLALI